MASTNSKGCAPREEDGRQGRVLVAELCIAYLGRVQDSNRPRHHR